jgi:hypothetical protein
MITKELKNRIGNLRPSFTVVNATIIFELCITVAHNCVLVL